MSANKLNQFGGELPRLGSETPAGRAEHALGELISVLGVSSRLAFAQAALHAQERGCGICVSYTDNDDERCRCEYVQPEHYWSIDVA